MPATRPASRSLRRQARTNAPNPNAPANVREALGASGAISVPSAKVTSTGPPQPAAMPSETRPTATPAGRTPCRSSGCGPPRPVSRGGSPTPVQGGAAPPPPPVSRAGRSRAPCPSTCVRRTGPVGAGRTQGETVRRPCTIAWERQNRETSCGDSCATGRSAATATRTSNADLEPRPPPRKRRGREARRANGVPRPRPALSRAVGSRGHEAVVAASGQARTNRP